MDFAARLHILGRWGTKREDPGWKATGRWREAADAGGWKEVEDGAGEEGALEKDVAQEGSEDGSKPKAEEAGEVAKEVAREKEAPSKSKLSIRAKYSSEIRIAIFGSIATVLVAAIFAPVRYWAGGALDEVHDFTLGYYGKRADTVKETVEDRPFWQEGPSFKDGAISYIERVDEEEKVVSTLDSNGTKPVAITVDELVNRAGDYEGEPVIVVGKEYEETQIDLDEQDFFPIISREVVLTGNDHYAYVGTSKTSLPWRGLVAYAGILMAAGRAYSDEVQEGVPTAYFFGAKGIEVHPRDPALNRELRDLAPDEFK